MEDLVLQVGLALIFISVAALVAARLRFTIVPLLILAGIMVGPHAPVIGPIDLRFLQSAEIIHFMGRVGVLLLLFYLGLEFSLGRFLKAGRSVLIGGTIYVSLNFTLGLLLGYLLGFPPKEVLVVAGIMTSTSTAIVAKVIVELNRTANPETEMLLGMILFDDIFLALYLSILSGLVLSGATSLVGIITSASMALGFMIGLLAIGRKLVPWLNRVLDIKSDEIFILVVMAALFGIAGFSETLHVAEAIGALLLGLVLAETEHKHRIEHLLIPMRDFFGAIFFFSFGLNINPLTLGGAVLPALAAVVTTLFGNITAGMLAGRSAGLSHRASANLGITISSRGEISIVVANLAQAGGLAAALQPFAALYVLTLAILGPILTKESKSVYFALNKVFRWEKHEPVKLQQKL